MVNSGRPRLALIVPCQGIGDDPARLRSFEFLSQRIDDLAGNVTDAGPAFARVVLATGRDRAPDAPFSKARLLNDAAKYVDADLLWFHDADTYLPFADVWPRIRPHVVTQPFRRVVYLDADQTAAFLDRNPVALSGRERSLSVLGGGSVVIPRDVFFEVGGFNEAFVGYGIQDQELGDRLRAAANVRVLDDVTGVHLYHPHAVNRDMDYRANKRRREAGEFNGLGLPERGRDSLAHDTAIIVAVYGQDMARRQDARAVIAKLLNEQHGAPNVFVVEVGPNTLEDLSTNVSRYWYYNIPGGDENADLFQKEAIYNLAARSCTLFGARCLIFCDADCEPDTPYWALKLRDRLREDPAAVVQAFSWLIDTQDETRAGKSFAAAAADGATNISAKPGGAWAMTSDTWHDIDGFNPWLICGSGDSMFVMEAVKDSRASFRHLEQEKAYFQALYRPDVSKHPLAFIEARLTHHHHGAFANRAYNHRHYAMDAMGDPREYVLLDDKTGLLAWKNPGCWQRRVCRRRPEMTSLDATMAIVETEREKGDS